MPAGRLGSLAAALLLGLLLPGLLRATAEWGEERPGVQESNATSADPRPEKPGVCPGLQMDLNCTEKEGCLSDGDCEENLKCCQSSCGTICSLPNEKVGTCPSVDLPLLGLCENQCEEDSQCSGLMKCCRNGCGMVTCTIPKL